MYDSKGNLRVRAYTAGGALPVPNATVRIIGSDEENRNVARSVITDRDGVALFRDIPAPNIKYSLTPNPTERPYATYDLEAISDGYAAKYLKGVTVFSGIESFQPLNLIPITNER